jgi:hypothetical protein
MFLFGLRRGVYLGLPRLGVRTRLSSRPGLPNYCELCKDGMVLPHEYHPDIPKSCRGQCPPAEATPADRVVFRGIKKLPLADKDFLSHVENKTNGHDASNCQHWGLSVWLTEEAAEHGRRLMQYMRKWHVAKGTIAASDGVFLRTGSNTQEEHYTFWKCANVSVTEKFTIALYPVPVEPS